MKIGLKFLKKITPVVMAIAASLMLFVSTSAAQGSDASADKIKTKFKSTCAPCHGEDGSGTPLGKSMQAPDLRSRDVQKVSNTEMGHVISEGNGNMPPFKEKLTTDQMQGLIRYVRSLASKKEPRH